VNPDCSIAGHPEIFVIGDLAFFDLGEDRSLPGVAPVAMQQAAYVSKLIMGRGLAKGQQQPFRYRDRGSLAVIGRNKAVMVQWAWTYFTDSRGSRLITTER